MKKTLFSIVCPVILIFAMTVSAFAAPSASDVSSQIILGENPDGTITQTVSVSGEAVDGAANKRIILRMWHLGKNATLYQQDLDEDGMVDDMAYFAMFLQTRADSEGNFNFEFPFSENAGTYSTDIKIQGENVITIPIPTANINAVNAFIAKINNATQLNAMTALDFAPVFEASDDYGIITDIYNQLSETSKTAVLALIKTDLLENLRASVRNTMAVFTDILAEKTLLKIFEQSSDGEILLQAFDVYEDLLNIDAMEDASGIDDLYNDFDDKSAVLSSIGETAYDDVADLLNAFKSEVFVTAVKNAKYYSNIEPVVESNLDYLETIISSSDLDKYNDSSAVRKHVLKAINSKKSSIDDIFEFEDVFSKAVESYGKEDSDSSSRGNGGGGGSSMGPSINVDINNSTVANPVTTGYKDMEGHWAYPAVKYLSDLRIVSGRGDGVFDPDANITRAEYVKIIAETYNLLDDEAVADFADVPKDAWYYKYLAPMVKQGYITGDTDGNFNPNALISRQDMTVILYRVMIKKNIMPFISRVDVLFDDFDSVSHYAKNSVTYMSNMKLVNGSDGLFRPHAPSTRAEAAQIIYNAIMEVGAK